jgi:hypothetical protein
MRTFVLSFALAATLRADFLPSAWQHRKRLPVTAGEPVTAVHIDRQIYVHAQPRLQDLRVIHGTEEVPYMLTRQSGAREDKQVAVEILDKSATSEQVQFVLSLPRVTRHNRITLETPETNFKRKVRLEASADGKSGWAAVRKEAYIFDFTYESQHSSILSIEYPVSTKPYLRVSVEGWTDPKVLSGASAGLVEERPPVREVMQTFTKLTPVEEPNTSATLYELDFGAPGVPKDLIRFEVDGGAMFHRAVEIETSDDTKKGWAPHSRGVLYRTPDEESLWLQLGDTLARYLRVRIRHNDDKPLAVRSISAESILRRVIFPVNATGGDYWLYYGNPNARTPGYDLPMVLARSSVESARTVNAAAEEPNPGFQPPPPPVVPFSDRHPEVLYGVLGIAVLGLGFLTVKFLQKASAER